MVTAKQMQTLKQNMQRMNASLQTGEQAAADAGARVQQVAQAASAAADPAATAEWQQVAARGHLPRLVDTRSLGRPCKCKSVRETWKDWSFQFKTCLSGANPNAGVAVTKLQNVEVYNGLEARRQLVLKFEPCTARRLLRWLVLRHLLCETFVAQRFLVLLPIVEAERSQQRECQSSLSTNLAEEVKRTNVPGERAVEETASTMAEDDMPVDEGSKSRKQRDKCKM
eukprot:6481549-Amphidinium_carterae.1